MASFTLIEEATEFVSTSENSRQTHKLLNPNKITHQCGVCSQLQLAA